MRFTVVALVCVVALCAVAVAAEPQVKEDGAWVDSSNIAAIFARANAEAANHTVPLGAPMGGRYGVDISSPYGKSTFQCLRKHGFSFAIARIWESVCAVDSNGARSIKAAIAAGMSNVSGYLFPSFRCRLSASEQVERALAPVKGIKGFDKLWFDIETSGSDWGSHAANHAWLKEAVAKAESILGAGRVGIYTNANSWSVVMGNVKAFGSLPVWYAHYDGRPSYSDFTRFGAWSKPAMKQFNDAPEVCGASIDHNWEA